MQNITDKILPYFTITSEKGKVTVFVPFKHFYSECLILIQGEPQLHPLICLKGDCHRQRGCMDILAKRVHYFFQEIEPKAEVLIAYFKYPTLGESIKAGVFYKDLREPYFMTVNPYGFKKFQKEGTIKQWAIKEEFININGLYQTNNIIPVESLIKK